MGWRKRRRETRSKRNWWKKNGGEGRDKGGVGVEYKRRWSVKI